MCVFTHLLSLLKLLWQSRGSRVPLAFTTHVPAVSPKLQDCILCHYLAMAHDMMMSAVLHGKIQV